MLPSWSESFGRPNLTSTRALSDLGVQVGGVAEGTHRAPPSSFISRQATTLHSRALFSSAIWSRLLLGLGSSELRRYHCHCFTWLPPKYLSCCVIEARASHPRSKPCFSGPLSTQRYHGIVSLYSIEHSRGSHRSKYGDVRDFLSPYFDQANMTEI